MPTNQQRREAAKRKLQRQLVRREEARARRRRTTIVVGSIAVLLVAAGVVWLVTASNSGPSVAAGSDPSASDATDVSSSGPSTPCTYTAGGTAAKQVSLPTNTSPEQTGTVAASLDLNGETVDITLDRAKAPCAVNAFLSLASQKFYDGTSCHRLTKSAQLNVLQCGDPSGQGNGGPGYTYAAEPPTGENPYTVGTIAMANADNQDGSQFFIVYGTTKIAASYSVIGTVSTAGMKVIDAVAQQGVKDDRQDGAPVGEAKIGSVTVPEAAVAASTVWTSAAESSDALPSEAQPSEEPSSGEPSASAPSASPSAEPSGSSASAPASSTGGARTSAAVSSSG